MSERLGRLSDIIYTEVGLQRARMQGVAILKRTEEQLSRHNLFVIGSLTHTSSSRYNIHRTMDACRTVVFMVTPCYRPHSKHDHGKPTGWTFPCNSKPVKVIEYDASHIALTPL